ncbi:MAG: hypothetical protein ABSA77_06385 [Thermoguttaceae bacterium]|jgi:hypothetical protein
MTTSFADMPSWVIVAVLARIARFIQHFVGDRNVTTYDELQREAVDKAIQVAEESARNAIADPRASEFADSARRVSEDAIRNGDTRADVAALCASEAAAAVQLATDRQNLVKAAARVMEYIRRLDKPECDRILEDDIAEFVKLARGLTNNDPAPTAPAELDLVHRQAIHEAGHAVAACQLGIPFDTVRIIYNAEVDFAYDSNDYKMQLGYAAGAAAEDLVFGRRRDWGCVDDRRKHENHGGTDFESDVAEIRKYAWFSNRVLLKVASLLVPDHN